MHIYTCFASIAAIAKLSESFATFSFDIFWIFLLKIQFLDIFRFRFVTLLPSNLDFNILFYIQNWKIQIFVFVLALGMRAGLFSMYIHCKWNFEIYFKPFLLTYLLTYIGKGFEEAPINIKIILYSSWLLLCF